MSKLYKTILAVSAGIGIILGELTTDLNDQKKFEKEKPYIKALFQEKNKKEMEEIILDEYKYLDKEYIPGIKEFDKQKFIKTFNEEVKPEVEKILGYENITQPEIKTGTEFKIYYTRETIASLIGLTALMMGVYLGKNKLKKLSKKLIPLTLCLTASFVTQNLEDHRTRIFENTLGVYRRKNQSMTINASRLAGDSLEATIIAAHEYTHHIQRITTKNLSPTKTKIEGFARVIETEIAKDQPTEYRNGSLYNEITELKGVYELMCKELELEQNDEVKRAHLIGDGLTTKKYLFYKREYIDPYPVGNFLIRIYMKQNPKETFKDILEDKYEDFDKWVKQL